MFAKIQGIKPHEIFRAPRRLRRSTQKQDAGVGVSVAAASGSRVSGLTVKDARTQTGEAMEIAGAVRPVSLGDKHRPCFV